MAGAGMVSAFFLGAYLLDPQFAFHGWQNAYIIGVHCVVMLLALAATYDPPENA